MGRCPDFKYSDVKMFLLKLVSELQNLVKKFAVQYENINKLQTAFPRSGMHNPHSPPCTHLFDFGNPPSCERSKLYIIPFLPPPPLPNS